MPRSTIKIAIVALAILAGPIAASAWTSAPASPPSSNVSAPLNAGGVAQSKSGGLLLNTGGATNGLIVEFGKVGIGAISPSYKLQVGNSGDGSSVGSNAFFYISDAKFKDNIVTLENALDNVLKLRGVSYTWKNGGARDIGVVAQEVEKIYPEAVNTAANGDKSVDYGHLVGPLIEAIKSQQTEIDALKAEIAALRASR